MRIWYLKGESIILYLGNIFGEKIKEWKREEGKGKEKKRNEREITLVCVGMNEREMRAFSSNLFNFEEIRALKKNPSNPFNFLPSHFAIQTRNLSFLQISPLPFPPFLSIQTHPNSCLLDGKIN